MSKLTLCLGVHNHQPVGNFGHVFEEALHKGYAPFFRVAGQHPAVKWNLHFSGPLFEWLDAHAPALLDEVAARVRGEQYEFVGAGFHEPILASLPPRDAEWQMDRMGDYLTRRFGQRQRGIWLTERVWEPGLPALIAKKGREYTLVDDHHFYYAGFPRQPLVGYHAVEKHGHTLKVFPISQALRYRIPFAERMEDLMDFLKRILDNHPRGCTLTYFDDGEKFGIWPGTFEWVYEKGWLDQFLSAIEKNADWLNTALLSEVIDREPPQGRASLPTASYMEMMEWAMPPAAILEVERFRAQLKRQGFEEQAKTLLKGGTWDQFLVKYEESNRIHKRMLMVSQAVARNEDALHILGTPSDDARRKALAQAREHLSRGQCNDAFWHGLFGGLYLPFLRQALHRELIAAERILHATAGLPHPPVTVTAQAATGHDFSGSGEAEIVVGTPHQVLVIAPAKGGTIYLWDDLTTGFSYTDTLTRREEAYHDQARHAAAELRKAQMPSDAAAGKDGEGHGAPEGGGGAAKTIHDIVKAKSADLDEKLIYDRHTRLSGRFAVWTAPQGASQPPAGGNGGSGTAAVVAHGEPFPAVADLVGDRLVDASGFATARFHLDRAIDMTSTASGATPSGGRDEMPGFAFELTAEGTLGTASAMLKREFVIPRDRAGFAFADTLSVAPSANGASEEVVLAHGTWAAWSLALTHHATGDVGRYIVVDGDPGLPLPELPPGVGTSPADAPPWPANRFTPGQTRDFPSAQCVRLMDHSFGYELTITWSRPARLVHFPLETVSNSEAGFESIHQGSAWTILVPLAEARAHGMRFEFRTRRLHGEGL